MTEGIELVFGMRVITENSSIDLYWVPIYLWKGNPSQRRDVGLVNVIA